MGKVMSKLRRLAVVGAGGLVGRRVVRNLSKASIDGLELTLTGHGKSVGKGVSFGDRVLAVGKTDVDELRTMDAVILCTPTAAPVDSTSSKGVPSY